MIDPIRGTLAIVFAAVAIAWAIGAVGSFRAKRRSARNRRFADIRFSPSADEIEKRYAEYQAPTYLRTRPEEQQLMPPIMRRQAGHR